MQASKSRVSISRVADHWIGWRAKPSSQALASVAHLHPATLITGASEGFGLALARILAEEGRTIILAARSTLALNTARDDLRTAYPAARIIALQLDVGSPDATAAIDACLNEHALYLDVLVNNAGIGVGGAFAQLDPHRLEELNTTNVMAVSRLMRHYLPGMRARGRGGIMNLASLAAFAPGPWQAPYFASKAYVLSLTAAVASECFGLGVRICAVACGPFESGIHAKMGSTTTLYRALLPSYSAENMARICWRSYRLGLRVVTPGWSIGVLAAFMRALPLELLLPIVNVLMKPRRWTFSSRLHVKRLKYRIAVTPLRKMIKR